MGASGSNLDGKVGLDIGDYKAKVNELNTQIRVVESGFRASAAALGDWSKDADGMQLRTQSLTKVIDLQRQKVENLTKVYEEVVEKEGAGSKSAQEYQIKINKATEELNKHEKELKDNNLALDEMKKGTHKAGDAVETMGKDVKSSGNRLVEFSQIVTGLNSLLELLRKGFQLVVNAARMVINELRGSVDLASDLGETISKTEVVFGDAAGQVLKFGDTSAKALGMTKNAALGAAATYGNLLRAMGFTADESANMSTELVQLAADLASFNNLDPEEVLTKLRAGLTGEAEPLKTLGVNLNQARIESKALEMGLIKQKEKLDAAAKAQAAYAIIMEDTALAQGDFARTSGGQANQQRILTAQWEDAKTKLGTGLLPLVTLGTTLLNNFLSSAGFTGGLEKFTGWLERLSGILSGLLNGDTSLEDFGDEITSFVEDLGAEMSGIGAVVLKGISKVLPQMLPIIGKLLTQMVGFMVKSMPTLTPQVVNILLMLVDLIIQNLPMFLDAALQMVIALANGLAQAAPTLIPQITGLIIQIVNILVSNAPLLSEAGIALLLAVVQGLITALPILIEAMPQIIGAIVNAILAILPQVMAMGIQLIQIFVQGITQSGPGILSALGRALAAALLGAGLIAAKFLTIGKNIVDSVWKGIQANASKFYNDVKNFFVGLVNKAKEALSINSPSKPFIEIGSSIVEGTGLGFKRQFKKFETSISQAMGNLPNLAFDGMSAGARFGMQTVSNSEAYAFYGPVIIQESAGSLGQAVKAKRF